jgi:hypothetical protein
MLVSVVIPVYKAAEYLKEAVESALNQTETGEVCNSRMLVKLDRYLGQAKLDNF